MTPGMPPEEFLRELDGLIRDAKADLVEYERQLSESVAERQRIADRRRDLEGARRWLVGDVA